MAGKLTPQQRVRLAQNLRKQTNQPGWSPAQRQEKRRLAANLMKIKARRGR